MYGRGEGKEEGKERGPGRGGDRILNNYYSHIFYHQINPSLLPQYEHFLSFQLYKVFQHKDSYCHLVKVHLHLLYYNTGYILLGQLYPNKSCCKVMSKWKQLQLDRTNYGWLARFPLHFYIVWQQKLL